MAYEYRSAENYFFTTLLNPAAVADTVLTSADFAALPTDYSAGTPGKYLPLVLHDPALGLKEIVWVTGHSSGSTQVSVVRGKEGTASRAWNAGALVESAPTNRDIALPLASTALPSDAAVGSRFPLTDKGVVVQKTKTAGYQADVGVCVPADVGPNMYGNRPPNDATMLIRAGQAAFTVNSLGQGSFSFQNPFPNGFSSFVATSTAGPLREIILDLMTNAGVRVLCFNSAGVELPSGSFVSFNYVAVGW